MKWKLFAGGFGLSVTYLGASLNRRAIDVMRCCALLALSQACNLI